MADRKIHNEAQRHEIRSHVMRGVRQQEHAQGKKRPTGRGLSRTKSSEKLLSVTRRSSSTSDYARSPVTPIREDAQVPDSFSFGPMQNVLVKTKSESNVSPTTPTDLRYQPFEPLGSTPAGGLSVDSIDALLHYCKLQQRPGPHLLMIFRLDYYDPDDFPSRKQAGR